MFKGKKFNILGSFKKKTEARKVERSKKCNKKCFILTRSTKRGIRHIVLKKRKK